MAATACLVFAFLAALQAGWTAPVPRAAATEAGSDAATGVPLHPELVLAFLAAGRAEEARDLADRVVHAFPDDPRAHVAYMRAVAQAGAGWRLEAEYRSLARAGSPRHALLAAWCAAFLASSEREAATLATLEAQAGTAGDLGRELLGTLLLEKGEVDRALQVLEGLATPDATRARVAALALQGRESEAAALVRSALVSLPERPDVAVGLWAQGLNERPLKQARREVLKAAHGLEGSADPRVLFRVWEVLVQAGEKDGAARVTERLAQRVPGLDLLPRVAFSAAMERHLGEALARSGASLDSVPLLPHERQAVALARARKLQADGQGEAARRAWLDLLATRPQDPEVLLEAGVELLEEAAPGLSPPDPERALEVALQARALVSRFPDTTLGPAPPAGRGDGEDSRLPAGGGEVRARADALLLASLVLEYRALVLLGRPEQALGALTLATRIQSDASLLVLRGDLEAQLGWNEAALASYAEAAARGREDAHKRVEALYHGPASAQALVESLRDWAPEPPSGRPREVGPPLRLSEDEIRLAAWSLQATTGPVLLQDLRGRVVVLVFWASWCEPCRRELPELARVVAGWSREGLDAELFAVSVDGTEADYRRGRTRLGDLGLVFARDPELARSLSLTGVPATWIVAPDGRVIKKHQGYAPDTADQVDRLVRRLATDKR